MSPTSTPTSGAMGHEVTILADEVAEGNRDPGVYDLHRARISLSPIERVMIGLWRLGAVYAANKHQYRRAMVNTFRRARAEHGIELFEMEESFGWARWISQASSVPVCVRLHGPWFLNGPAQGYPENEDFHRRVFEEGRAIAEADAVTASSSDVLERTRAYYGLALNDAEVIPPPTMPIPPAKRWRLEDCDRDLVLFIGRFDRHKGGDLIIEAFSRILQEVPRARLCFVGPDAGFVDSEGKRWGIEEFARDRLPGAIESGRLELHGRQPFSALDRLRRNALMTVVCSRYENAPRSLIEAMALGCPIVAADVGGIPDILRSGSHADVDGVLHRQGDPDDLAAKIVLLLNDPARAAELGRQAAASCERRFYPDVIASRLIDVYRDTIERAGSRKRLRGGMPWRRGGTSG